MPQHSSIEEQRKLQAIQEKEKPTGGDIFVLRKHICCFLQQQLKAVGTKTQEVCVIVVMAHVISMEPSLATKDKSKNDGETSRGPDQTIVSTDVVSTSCDIVD